MVTKLRWNFVYYIPFTISTWPHLWVSALPRLFYGKCLSTENVVEMPLTFYTAVSFELIKWHSDWEQPRWRILRLLITSCYNLILLYNYRKKVSTRIKRKHPLVLLVSEGCSFSVQMFHNGSDISSEQRKLRLVLDYWPLKFVL